MTNRAVAPAQEAAPAPSLKTIDGLLCPEVGASSELIKACELYLNGKIEEGSAIVRKVQEEMQKKPLHRPLRGVK
jgi:hypothetical protein